MHCLQLQEPTISPILPSQGLPPTTSNTFTPTLLGLCLRALGGALSAGPGSSPGRSQRPVPLPQVCGG